MVLSELVEISQRDLDKESSIYLSSSYSPIISNYKSLIHPNSTFSKIITIHNERLPVVHLFLTKIEINSVSSQVSYY